MARTPNKIIISDEDKVILIKRVKGYTYSKRDSIRANIILLKGEGKSQEVIEKELKISRRSIGKWINRFKMLGINGLNDAKGRGRKISIPLKKINTVLTKVTQPPAHKNRWSLRTMAKEVGISATSVGRIWRANDIKPHLTKTFKLSKDPNFERKFWDIIGLYLAPPDKALVLCCDEKSQCQALERSQPGLPLGIGHIKTKTHDYYRHGTTTLFAALNYLDGKIISRTDKKHRHEEWLKFLNQIDKETPGSLDIHLIIDNYSAHKHQNVKNWLKKHPRFHAHYTPTGSSWLNLVERFFADITNDLIREGSFCSSKELEDSIQSYMKDRNRNPRRYVWRKEGLEILKKINKARKVAGMSQYCEPI
jgi:transposase